MVLFLYTYTLGADEFFSRLFEESDYEREAANLAKLVLSVCCSVLQCVAGCCSVLQGVAVCCNVLQCIAVRCSESQCDADQL